MPRFEVLRPPNVLFWVLDENLHFPMRAKGSVGAPCMESPWNREKISLGHQVGLHPGQR